MVDLTRSWLEFGGDRLYLSSAARIRWELAPGPQPASAQVQVVAPRAEEWLGAVGRGPVALVVDGRRFDNLRVTRAVQRTPHHVVIRVADLRHDWRYVRVHLRLNLRRTINDLTLVTSLERQGDVTAPPSNGEGDTDGNSEVGEAEEGGGGDTIQGTERLRDDFRAIAERRYRRWTVLGEGQPWSAKQYVVLILDVIEATLGLVGQMYDRRSVAKAPDNGEIIDEVEALGESAPQVLAEALRKAELSIGVRPDGIAHLYDPFAIPTYPPSQIKGGAMRVPSLARIRPAEIHAYAQVERDVRAVAVNSREDLKGAGGDEVEDVDPQEPAVEVDEETGLRTCHLIPVIQLTKPAVIRGRERVPGEYVPVWDALDAWGIDEQDVRDYWFFGGQGLLLKHARRIINGKIIMDPIVSARIMSILDGYRQLYMIEPRYRDQLRRWRAQTTTIISQQTHERQPSPVYTEWYDLYPALPLTQRRGPADVVGANHSSWLDAEGNEVEEPHTAPAVISVEDQDIGVLRVTFTRAHDGGVAERIPSQVDNPPQVFSRSGQQLIQFFTKSSSLVKAHRLETILSVIEGVPNVTEEEPRGAEAGLWRRRFRNGIGSEPGQAPTQQVFVRQDTARLDQYGKLRNEEQLSALARAEARSVALTYEDRPIGVLNVAHDPRADWELSGHVRSIAFEVDTNGAVTVTVNAAEPPPPRRPIRFLPHRVRQFLHRVLPTE